MSKHKAPRATGATPGSARSRLAAERQRQAAARKRRLFVGIPVGVVVLAIVVLVGVRFLVPRHNGPTSGGDPVITNVTSVPPAVLDKVGIGTAEKAPQKIDGAALTANGKPRILYVGAEYCPYCATERWALVVALSRFGTFSGLGQTSSTPNDVHPNTPTLSFHGATYTSDLITFSPVETADRDGKPLDTLSKADQALLKKYDSPPYVDAQSAGSIPFIDYGGKYMDSGASYDTTVLDGKTHQQVAQALSDPNSDIAKGVDGDANVITATICKLTGGKPTNVCTAAGVAAAAGKLQ